VRHDLYLILMRYTRGLVTFHPSLRGHPAGERERTIRWALFNGHTHDWMARRLLCAPAAISELACRIHSVTPCSALHTYRS